LPAVRRFAEMDATLPEIHLANLLTLPDGRSVEWEAVGAGEPLLWIEGGPGLPAHLARPDVELIADRFRCFLVNAPGCGRTSPPVDRDGYGIDGHVQFFDAVRRALGLGQVTLMGHSWGGLIAVAYAAVIPEPVRRLVVIDGYLGDSSVDAAESVAERERALDRVRDRPWFPAAMAASAIWDQLELITPEELREADNPNWPLYFAEPESGLARAHIERIGREVRWNVDVLRSWASSWSAIDLRPALARITCPTLVVAGEHDFICGPVWNRPIAAGIRGAEYVEIPGTGHLPQYEAPEVFRRILFDWLERT
jgi:pimeloyl-ACP methyl ester carboxylesterase